MKIPFRFSPFGRQRLALLDQVLDDRYDALEELLGNQNDPLDEAVYIILSFQTNLRRFRETWSALKTAFLRWDEVMQVSVNDLAGVLRMGGLHRQKAQIIMRLLRTVKAQFGELSLDALREMSDKDAERVLTKLPGLSWKGARCILLYSLDRQVLPVDVNTFRILKRTGVIPISTVYRRLSVHNAIQKATEPSRRRRLHVNLVLHGQETCLPQNPHCDRCTAADICLMREM